MRPIAAAILAIVLSITACGSDQADDATGQATAGDAPTAQATDPGGQTKTATDVAVVIKSEIPEVSQVVTITEVNDPNDKIGRPGGYVDGAVLYDSRAEPLDQEPGVDQGAFLEVWPDETAATDRSEFIQTALQETGGVLGSEYHYQQGEYLLRVSGVLPPSQAAAYETAFSAQF